MNGFEILFHKKPITKTEILKPSFFCFWQLILWLYIEIHKKFYRLAWSGIHGSPLPTRVLTAKNFYYVVSLFSDLNFNN